MIRRFYTLALTCDVVGDHLPQHKRQNFFAATDKQADADATSAGWLVGSAIAICPACQARRAERDAQAEAPPF